MAADQTNVRRNWGSLYVAQASNFMIAYEQMLDLDTRATSAGLTFVDSDFAGTANAQLDAATVTAARALMTTIKTFMDGVAGAGTRKDALNKLRP